MSTVEQKAQKSFAFKDARDMIAKLRWELGNFNTSVRHDFTGRQYHAFNAAVTAWHVTDWLWEDLPTALRSELKLKDSKSFQAYVRAQCPALRLCHQIANGSKHCLLTLGKPDPSISGKMTDGEDYDYGNPVIVDGDTEHFATLVFWEALRWFEDFLSDHQLFPEDPFVPMGDC